MANIIASVPKQDVPKQDWKYITIPETDLIGRDYEVVMINNDVFEPGKTYKVNLDIAEELQGMINRRFAVEQGLFRDTADLPTRQKLARLLSNQMAGAVTTSGNDVAIVDRYVAEGKLVG